MPGECFSYFTSTDIGLFMENQRKYIKREEHIYLQKIGKIWKHFKPKQNYANLFHIETFLVFY